MTHFSFMKTVFNFSKKILGFISFRLHTQKFQPIPFHVLFYDFQSNNMRKQISNRFNEILLKREKRELRYKLAKLSFLTERKKEIEQETNIVMKILNFIPNNHLIAEYQYLMNHRNSIESRIDIINLEINGKKKYQMY